MASRYIREIAPEYDRAAAMRRPAGHIIVGTEVVADTAQCVHCGMHFVMVKGSGRVRGWCPKCNGIVCGPKCAACVPMEQAIEQAEARGFR